LDVTLEGLNMRPEVHIFFDTADVPRAHALLEPAGCGPDVANVEEVPVLREVQVRVTLVDTDERLPGLRELLKRHGMRWSEVHQDRYTDEELDNARLLVMDPNRECEMDGGVEFGMTFDFSHACQVCGAGARQTSALLLNGDDNRLSALEGHRVARTYYDHLLVDERLAAELEELGPTGLAFHNVYAIMPDKRQVKLRWKQLSADRVLPPVSPRTTGLHRYRPCEACGRSGYTGTQKEPMRIVYRASDLASAADINLTWEEYGFGVLEANLRDSKIPVPRLMVTPKVMHVFRAAGVTEIDWLPIRVDDS
jgi:hypothetical protein